MPTLSLKRGHKKKNLCLSKAPHCEYMLDNCYIVHCSKGIRFKYLLTLCLLHILTTLKAKANNGGVKNDDEIAVSSMDPLLVIEPDIFDKSHFVMLSKKY